MNHKPGHPWRTYNSDWLKGEAPRPLPKEGEVMRAPLKTYEFEGKVRTVADIHAMVGQCVSDAVLRRYLAKGFKTIREVREFDPKSVMAKRTRAWKMQFGSPRA